MGVKESSGVNGLLSSKHLSLKWRKKKANVSKRKSAEWGQESISVECRNAAVSNGFSCYSLIHSFWNFTLHGSVKSKQLIGSGIKLNYELMKGKSSGEWRGKHFPRKSLNYHFANLVKVEKTPPTQQNVILQFGIPHFFQQPQFPAVPEAGHGSLRLGPEIKSTSRRPKIKLTSRRKSTSKSFS